MMKININFLRNKKRNKKMIWGVGILVVLAVILGWSLSNQGTEAETATAGRGDIHKHVEEIGEVKGEDSTTVYLEGNGLIVELAADEGQTVKKGDLLLSMDQAQLEIGLKNAEEQLREARAQSAAGEEAYRTALKDYNNTKYLAEEGAVSQWELTQKETELKNAEAVRSGYQAMLSQAELSRQNSSLSLGKQQVLAPIDGIVLERNVELNEPGEPGTAAFVIGNPDKIEIESKLLAEDAASVKVGDEAVIISRTDEKQEIKGTVTKIAPTATDEISSLGVKQKKVAVTVKPLESAASLKLGSEVDVRVITETRTDVIIVPAGAVFDYQGESSVFAVEGGKAVLRTVKSGIRNESFTEITDGLKEGEVVLSVPDNSIENGMRIKSVTAN